MMTMGNCCVEMLSVLIIPYFLTKNTVLKSVIRNLDDGIIIISFGNVLDQIYLSVIGIPAKFVRGSFFIDIEGNLLDPQI